MYKIYKLNSDSENLQTNYGWSYVLCCNDEGIGFNEDGSLKEIIPDNEFKKEVDQEICDLVAIFDTIKETKAFIRLEIEREKKNK